MRATANKLLVTAFNEDLIESPIIQGTGRHNGKCISITLKSKQSKRLTIQIESGWMLIAVESRYQNMLITDSLPVVLEPLEEKTVLVYAMCTQSYDASPSSTCLFTLGDYAPEPLATLAHYIFRKKYQDSFGQNAVWNISNNLTSLADRNTKATMEEVASMHTYVEDLYKNPPRSVTPRPRVTRRVVVSTTTTVTYTRRTPSNRTALPKEKAYLFNLKEVHPEGGVPYAYAITSAAGRVSLTLVDAAGKKIADVYANELVGKGSHRDVLRIGDYHLANGKYELLIMIDGKAPIRRPFWVTPNADTDQYNEFRAFLEKDRTKNIGNTGF